MDVRTSQEIDKELQAERETIKRLQSKLEAAKAEATKAEQAQDRTAYQALAHDDKAAQKRLDEAEDKQAKAARRAKSYEKAIAQAMQRFEQFEHEWRKALADEAWAELMAEAELAQKEAVQLDVHATAMAKLLSEHGERLNHLKSGAHNLGFPRCFGTLGLRHFDRTFAWKMIQAGFAGEYEKPSEQFRKASGYATILAEQIAAAKNIHDHTNMEQGGQDGGGPGAEGNGEAAMEPGTETEAGATATYIQVRPDDPEAPLPGQVWLKSGAGT